MARSESQLKAWMLGGLDGDAAAHAALLGALLPLLQSFYRRRMLGAESDVDDLVQDTLITVHTRRSTYDRDRPFTAWLYAIARHRLVDHYRRRRITVSVEDLETMLAIEGFENAITARVDVEALLSSLSEKQAWAIRAMHIEGLSAAEAAAGAGLGESDVKVSVHRGLKALAAKVRGK